MAVEIEHIVQQQEQQAGRLSTLETEVRHVTEAVGQVTAALETGFRETREMIEQVQERNDRRTTTIHERLDKQVERGRWNPGLTLAAITCAVLIGGVFVAFVQMTTTPVKENISRIITKIDADGNRNRDNAAAVAAVTVQISDMQRRIAEYEKRQTWQQQFDSRLRTLEYYGHENGPPRDE